MAHPSGPSVKGPACLTILRNSTDPGISAEGDTYATLRDISETTRKQNMCKEFNMTARVMSDFRRENRKLPNEIKSIPMVLCENKGQLLQRKGNQNTVSRFIEVKPYDTENRKVRQELFTSRKDDRTIMYDVLPVAAELPLETVTQHRQVAVDNGIYEMCQVGSQEMHHSFVLIGTERKRLINTLDKIKEVILPDFDQVCAFLTMYHVRALDVYTAGIRLFDNLRTNVKRCIKVHTDITMTYTYRMRDGSVGKIGEVTNRMRRDLDNMNKDNCTDSEERLYRNCMHQFFQYLLGIMDFVKSISDLKSFVERMAEVFEQNYQKGQRQMNDLAMVERERQHVLQMYIELQTEHNWDFQVALDIEDENIKRQAKRDICVENIKEERIEREIERHKQYENEKEEAAKQMKYRVTLDNWLSNVKILNSGPLLPPRNKKLPNDMHLHASHKKDCLGGNISSLRTVEKIQTADIMEQKKQRSEPQKITRLIESMGLKKKVCMDRACRAGESVHDVCHAISERTRRMGDSLVRKKNKVTKTSFGARNGTISNAFLTMRIGIWKLFSMFIPPDNLRQTMESRIESFFHTFCLRPKDVSNFSREYNGLLTKLTLERDACYHSLRSWVKNDKTLNRKQRQQELRNLSKFKRNMKSKVTRNNETIQIKQVPCAIDLHEYKESESMKHKTLVRKLMPPRKNRKKSDREIFSEERHELHETFKVKKKELKQRNKRKQEEYKKQRRQALIQKKRARKNMRKKHRKIKKTNEKGRH